MANNDDFQETFKQLKAILKPYAAKLHVVHDTETNYYLDTHLVMKNKQRVFFGAVRTGKAYVSFHLMPVYASAELERSISLELKKRMQGKSCFNFKTPDKELFKELAKLTKSGFAMFHNPEFLQKILPR
ncbi:MAG TPA: hypothetical protein VMS31_01545 [Pyrinomonadaceae bacterium]|nr:hypothetical protein [Pyrinomonadaceae bacterium]